MWRQITLCSFTLSFFAHIYALKMDSVEDLRRSFLQKRAVDGTRGRKYFVLSKDESFDIYGSYDEKEDFSEYKGNIPGEPGLDYPSFIKIPQTNFRCEDDYRGYYADEEAGCQLFHVCDDNFLVSSFLCPVGSIFSQKFLTCDWWNNVDCSKTRNFHQVNNQIINRRVDNDEIFRKIYEMTNVQSTGAEVSDFKDRFNDGVNRRLPHVNDLQSRDASLYRNIQDSPSTMKKKSLQLKYSSRYSSALNQHDRNTAHNSGFSKDEQLPVQIKTHGKDYNNADNKAFSRFRPFYAATVPTVTPTTRRYYSPTIPTIIRSTSTSDVKNDLEFESSDHLYSAKEKRLPTTKNSAQSMIDNIRTTLPTVTSPIFDTTTPIITDKFSSVVLNEIPRILTVHNETNSFVISSLVLQAPLKREREIVIRNISDAVMAPLPLPVEFHHHINENIVNNEGNRTNNLQYKPISVIINPATDIRPSFYYYSNAAQHDAVFNDTPEKLTFNLSTLDNSVLASSVDLRNESKEVMYNRDKEEIVRLENSPFQAAVTLKNNEELNPSSELLKSLLAQQNFSIADYIKEIEIIKSKNGKTFNDVQRIIKYPYVHLPRTTNTGVIARPFSLNPHTAIKYIDTNKNKSITHSPQYLPVKNCSECDTVTLDDVTTEFLVLEDYNSNEEDESLRIHSDMLETLDESRTNFNYTLSKIERQTIFNLPHRERFIDFQNGKPVRQKIHIEQKFNNGWQRTASNDEKKQSRVETELVQSVGFSLNTEEERKHYVDAVRNGLFRDINISDIKLKSLNTSDV